MLENYKNPSFISVFGLLVCFLLMFSSNSVSAQATALKADIWQSDLKVEFDIAAVTNSETPSLVIFDVAGKLITYTQLELKNGEYEKDVDLSNESKGWYIVLVVSSSGLLEYEWVHKDQN